MKRKQTNRNKVSPFEGEPCTISTQDKHGNSFMLVNISEITPLGALLADALSWITTFILFVFLFFAGAVIAKLLVWIACTITLFVMHLIIVQVFYSIMMTDTNVMFTPTEFRVRKGKNWQVYDRTLTHRFVMMKHDKAKEEREKHELKIRRAQARGQIVSPKRYYDESFHIIFDYLGQRFDVATIYDQKRATAVVTRLKACDKVMDTKNQMGEGEVLNPSEQWGKAPGTRHAS